MALTEKQAKILGDKMIDTSGNIYRVAEGMGFGDLTEEDWDLVKRVGGIFRCEECSVWKSDREKVAHREDCCDDCSD